MIFFQKLIFFIRNIYLNKFFGFIRNKYYSILGMKIGKNTYLPQIYIPWPHQVKIGNNCNLEHSIFLKFEGIWNKGPSIIIGDNVFLGNNCEFNIGNRIEIGNDTLIASGCKFIDHDHGISIGNTIRSQKGIQKEILIGNDVWLGCNVTVLKGIVIENGAIVGAGSIVTKSISKNEIWAGVPAKKIGERH